MSSFLSQSWCALDWTAWVILDSDSKKLKVIPNSAGVYRVRSRGEARLVWIGQTGRNLRARLSVLSKNAHSIEMPFRDPHTAAPCLWVLRKEFGMQFECSAAAVTLTSENRRSLEDMLLWKYRTEGGESTLCNYGRFHSRYFPSSSQKSGKRGGKLAARQTNPAGGPSSISLEVNGQPWDATWMGLSWSPVQALQGIGVGGLPREGGLYKILNRPLNRLLYVGETGDLQQRLTTHSRADWGESEAVVSFHVLPEGTPDHQRLEMESDLLGAYFSVVGEPPPFQYRKH